MKGRRRSLPGVGNPDIKGGNVRGAAEEFRLSSLFPEHNGTRGPFPKQAQIYAAMRSGELQGGGAIYQGGKGSGKTFTGAAADIWVHHKWPGTKSLIGRESYPSLCTSTAQEFFDMLGRLPSQLVAGYSRPSKNSMGHVDWKVGGVTLLCSLSNSDTWESANLGFVWVDEFHRQLAQRIRDLISRLRQPEGPRCLLGTTNPAGKGVAYDLAHPDGKGAKAAKAEAARKGIPFKYPWLWMEASSIENPALPQDYLDRLVAIYGFNTPAYKRWVLGQSSALEGAVFTEFDPNPEAMIHVVPPFDLPEDWLYGRGLDYGLANPTAVVWAACSPENDWFVFDGHYQPGWAIPDHARVILEKDAYVVEKGARMRRHPADPSMFARIHVDKLSGRQYSNADEFHENGVKLTPGNNDRKPGLAKVAELIAVDLKRAHYITLQPGAPRLFIFDIPANEPLIQELANLQWEKPEGSLNKDRPDDTEKKNDHAYDALRYLLNDTPEMRRTEQVRRPGRVRETSRGPRVGY